MKFGLGAPELLPERPLLLFPRLPLVQALNKVVEGICENGGDGRRRDEDSAWVSISTATGPNASQMSTVKQRCVDKLVLVELWLMLE